VARTIETLQLLCPAAGHPLQLIHTVQVKFRFRLGLKTSFLLKSGYN
jgi:hypothetical protein